jgi:hypothetical protein
MALSGFTHMFIARDQAPQVDKIILKILSLFVPNSELLHWSIGFIAVAWLTLTSGQCGATELRPQIEALVNAWELRDKANRAGVHIEYQMFEQVSPGGLVANSRSANAVPNHEIQMKRKLAVTFSGSDWRVDEEGGQLFGPGSGAMLEARDQKSVFLVRKGEVRTYHHIAGPEPSDLGTIQRAEAVALVPYANDVAHISLFLFVSPSRTRLFNSIATGGYEMAPDAASQAEHELCIRDKRFGTTIVWVDTKRGYRPKRMRLPGRMHVEIEYDEFEGVGAVPHRWTCTKLSEDEKPVRIWMAAVHKWENEADAIEGRFDFQFPKGTKVTNLSANE